MAVLTEVKVNIGGVWYAYIVAGATTNQPDWSWDYCKARPNTKYINWDNEEIPAPGHGELEPPTGVWYTLDRNVDDDFPGIDWSTVTEITIMLHHHGGYLYMDDFKVFFDDLELQGPLEDLKTEIEELPPEAFKYPNWAELLKKALCKKVDIILNLIEKGSYEAALMMLKGLRLQIKKWIVDDYVDELIEKVDVIIDILKPEATVYGYGWFISEDFDWREGEVIGDKCYFGIGASVWASVWKGRGIFRDKDYPLTAILTVTGGDVDVESAPYGETGWWRLWGTAKVYIGGEFVECFFGIDIVDGEYYTATGEDEFAIYIGDTPFGPYPTFEAAAGASWYVAWSGLGLDGGNIKMIYN